MRDIFTMGFHCKGYFLQGAVTVRDVFVEWHLCSGQLKYLETLIASDDLKQMKEC